MKVKIFDCEHEADLERKINEFIRDMEDIVDIKYQINSFYAGQEQIYSFSAMIIYGKIYQKNPEKIVFEK